MKRVSARSRVRSFSRLAAVVTLVSMSAGSLPDTASAAPGSRLWAKRYDGPAHRGDKAYALEVSPDGSVVFVTGSSKGSTSYFDYATVAYDSVTGAKLWAKRYDGPGNDGDSANALAVSPDGSQVFVTGISVGSTSGLDYATVAYDASTGVTLWAKRYNGPGNSGDSAAALEMSPDGGVVFVTGYSFGSTSDVDYGTVAYDASAGVKLWAKRYNGPGNLFDYATALGVSPDGSEVFVTGYSAGPTSDTDYATVAYDTSTGARLWARRYDGGYGSDLANALGVSPDGSEVFVTGYSAGPTSDTDYATVSYDASTGAKLWSKRYNGPANSYDHASALGVSPDGSEIFVTGDSEGSTSGADYATVSYDASTGAKLWSMRYNGSANSYDDALALGVRPDGSEVFVTGSSLGSTTGLDYATVAYDASTGAKAWTKLYNGPGSATDDATALGVSPDGSEVFVTGQSAGSTTGWDYATVDYSAA
jgi:hypothetical protein